MKVWSKGTVLLVLGAAGAGWMAGHSTGPKHQDAPASTSNVTSPRGATHVQSLELADSLQPSPEAPIPVLLMTRAERSGVSDVARRSSELIESQRDKPMFGEWSMKYMVVEDVLRADVNQDDWLTSEDFAQFIAWMQQGDPCADFNADGLLDVRDVETFVASYTSEELIDARRDEPRAC